jgi:hypothetical protein
MEQSVYIQRNIPMASSGNLATAQPPTVQWEGVYQKSHGPLVPSA